MKKYILPLLAIGCFTLCCVGQGWAQDPKITSVFDRRSVAVNEEIHLTIRISDSGSNIQAPRLPAYPNFDIFYTGRASNFTFVNGQSTSTVEFSYTLVPRVAGKFTLDPIEVVIENRVFRTEPITIEVSQAQSPVTTALPQPVPAPSARTAAPAPSNVQPPATAPPQGDDNIFVQAWIDKTNVYPNEQVVLTYSLYTRYDTRYEGFEEEPSISGFWIEEFPMEKDIARETVRVNGKRYVKADIRKIALFPTAAADYTIQPGTLKVSIRQDPDRTSIFDDFFNDSFFSGGGFFARRENRILAPAPMTLKVRPLPDGGKPENFQGAVGNFRISASIDKQSVKQDEPVTMTLIMEGEGNIERLNKPKIPELPNFKIYDADTSSQLFKTGVVIGGKKTFEIVFIPKKAGRMYVPPLEFSFFDPQAGRYVTRKTQEFAIEVAPSDQPFELPKGISAQEIFKKDVQVEGRDIRYIWEKWPEDALLELFRMSQPGLAVVNGVLTLLFLFGLVRVRSQEILDKDTALKRRRLARSVSQSRIRKLKAMAHADRSGAGALYFEEVDKILTEYLANKFNLSAFGGTRLEFEEQLKETLGADDALFKEILHLYALCDESRFGKAVMADEHRAKALKILQQTINRVEKICR